jgi:hypothetical protein
MAKSSGHLTRNVRFYVRLLSFHHGCQALTMKAKMIRPNITHPRTSVRGNVVSDSHIIGSPVLHQRSYNPYA